MGPKQKFSAIVTDATILKVDEGDVKGGCETPPTKVAAQTCVCLRALWGLRAVVQHVRPQINALTTLSPALNAPSVCLHGEGETEWKDLRGVL